MKPFKSWTYKTGRVDLDRFDLTLSLAHIPEQTGMQLAIEARRGDRYYRVVNDIPYDSLLNDGMVIEQRKIHDKLAAAIEEYETANPVQEGA